MTQVPCQELLAREEGDKFENFFSILFIVFIFYFLNTAQVSPVPAVASSAAQNTSIFSTKPPPAAEPTRGYFRATPLSRRNQPGLLHWKL